ncbi:hypothetical protein GCM10007939_22110 [Amylibacter marinus]|uniref:Response regulatory domain-containing protein n=1 Tax=Amylibacter marinus TaxID=1475483 RepID=A0ABQ5VXJ6_9RHOB|nr:response regulator [Amylibacter marinus]GLQ35927.1 hypothetical protein GCM10007939_22110 [Amylibacter marinus]
MYQILIADDNKDFADYLATIARGQGWIPKTCSDGIELNEILNDCTEPVLLMVDINMPRMNGLEAIDGISTYDFPLRVRFMTGGGDTSMIAAKMIANARDVPVGRNVYKPIAKDSFISLLSAEMAELERAAPQA